LCGIACGVHDGIRDALQVLVQYQTAAVRLDASGREIQISDRRNTTRGVHDEIGLDLDRLST
jgi:hypothetical protein